MPLGTTRRRHPPSFSSPPPRPPRLQREAQKGPTTSGQPTPGFLPSLRCENPVSGIRNSFARFPARSVALLLRRRSRGFVHSRGPPSRAECVQTDIDKRQVRQDEPRGGFRPESGSTPSSWESLPSGAIRMPARMSQTGNPSSLRSIIVVMTWLLWSSWRLRNAGRPIPVTEALMLLPA